MVDWLADGIAILLLLIVAKLAWSLIRGADRRKLHDEFKDVIVSRWEDADFYYGKAGSEFDDMKVRNAIIKRDGWKCKKCGRKVNGKPKTLWQKLKSVLGFWRRLVIDHIVPFILGGLGIIANGRILCWSCNSRRGAKIDRDCLLKVRELGKKIYIGRKVPKFKYERNRK